LEKIEDPEDAMACKKAELEEKNFDIEEIDEFLKITEQGKELEEEATFINFDKLPRIYKYGYEFVSRMNVEEPQKNDESINEKEESEENEETKEKEEENEVELEVFIDNNINDFEEKAIDENKSFVSKKNIVKIFQIFFFLG